MIEQRHGLSTAAVPAARVDDLVMTESADELLVYDTRNHQIHHLNALSAAIWQLCDGQRTITEVAMVAGVDGDTARLALTKLDDAGLLETPLAATERVSGHSRRAFLRKAAVAAAIPAVVSVTAPTATMAQTPGQCADTQLANPDCVEALIGQFCWTGNDVGLGQCGTCQCPTGPGCNCDHQPV